MIVYHGSKVQLINITVKGSNPTNDYGPAFYVTEDLETSKLWACKNNTIGVVNKYELKNETYSKLSVLDLTDKSKYSVLNWLAILMHYRRLDSSFVKQNELTLKWLDKYFIDVDNYDVVKGYRADDAYFRFPIKFLSNELSIEDLQDVFMSGNLEIQYAFISKKAIDSLKYSKTIDCEDWFVGKYYSKIKEASKSFDELLGRVRDFKNLYIIDLMREENE